MSVDNVGTSASAERVEAGAISRVLHWEGCHNVRDLGGLSAANEQRTRWGALVRSDIPTRLTENGQRALVEHGVSAIVDLRYVDEVRVDWDHYPFKGGADGPTYSNVPFYDWGEGGPDKSRIAVYEAAATRAELNRLDLDLNRAGIAAAVAAIADAPVGGVLVHCHAGKDRTGIVVALILAVLGVADDEIADDYALTSANIEPLISEWLDSTTRDADERERLRALAMPAREAMLDTLEYVRSRYESAVEYLCGAGVTADQLERLRVRLLEPA